MTEICIERKSSLKLTPNVIMILVTRNRMTSGLFNCKIFFLHSTT